MRLEQAMQNLKISIAEVLSFDDQAGQSDAILRLGDTHSYTVSKKDQRFTIWSRLLRERQVSKGPVYVESDPVTGVVQNIFLPSVRRIESVALEPKDNRLNVTVFMAPSLYFIETTRADYEELRRMLEESARTKTPVLITIQPDTLEILDARAQAAVPTDKTQ
jgi:hypothetical protein